MFCKNKKNTSCIKNCKPRTVNHDHKPIINYLVSENICPPFANHRLKPNPPNDRIIFKIHFSIIRITSVSIIGRLIAIQHSKLVFVCWFARRHYRNHTDDFTHILLDALLGPAMLGCVTKIPTVPAFCVQQNWAHNISGTILNIVTVKPIVGSIEADFAEH